MADHAAWRYETLAEGGDESLAALGGVLSNAFSFPPDRFEVWSEKAGREHFRCVRSTATGEIAGGLLLVPMGQFFGGRSVPMAGVAAVGIRPEDRARGAASVLMREMIRELNSSDFALSALYPATQPVYQRAGFEQAGSICRIEIGTAHVDVRDREMFVMRADEEAHRDIVERLHRQRAGYANGNLDRGSYIWPRVFKPRGDQATGYVVGPGRGDVQSAEGYAFVLSKRDEAKRITYLVCSDLVANTNRAARALLAFIANHRSMHDRVVWFGSSHDPILGLLREQCYDVTLKDHWMVRIVNVRQALESRGYSGALDAEVHLDIHGDAAVPETNHGRWVLRVRDGQATADKGAGKGTLRLHINGLASLYTGFRNTWELARAGLLECDDDTTMSAASAVFAGPAPWMSDQF